MKVLMISRPTVFSVPGGDTVQMVETAKELNKMGIEAEILASETSPDYSRYDLLHFFNVIRPNSISGHVRKSGLPYVISTIFVDYTEIERKHRGILFKLLSSTIGSDGLDYLKTLARVVKNGESLGDTGYLWRGHRKSVEQLLNNAAMLLPNSHSEFQRLKQRYLFENRYMAIPNGVSEDFLNQPLTDMQQRHGVVCMGRIEVIKNQLNLIKALNGTDIPLTLIGKAAPNHTDYEEACRKAAGPNVRFLGQLSRDEVMAELKKARVHALPSFFETTGLSSLEAGAMGCKIVISDKGDQCEYFDGFAEYCNPEDPQSIRTAIERALSQPADSSLALRIRTEFTWKMAAQETAKAYNQVLAGEGQG